MSHVVLHRIMVRMLYDPDFTDRVLKDPGQTLAGLDLTETERGHLLTPDPRAWKVDPERPARSLTVLLQQYPATTVLVVRETGHAPLLDFFRHARFHRSIQERGSMALEFGAYLEDLVSNGTVKDPRVLPLSRLELAIAGLHRSISPVPSPTGRGAAYRLSPDKALLHAPAGTADLHEALHLALGASGTELAKAVLNPPGTLPDLGIRPKATEALLLELVRTDGPRVMYPVGATEVTEGLHTLLAFARATPRTHADLVARIVKLGADDDEAAEVIDGLIEDGTLVPVAEP